MLIQTGDVCTTSCITGLGGEDIVYTCVGVARIFPGVGGTIDGGRDPTDMWGGYFDLPCEQQEYCYHPMLSATLTGAGVVQIEDTTNQAYDRRGAAWQGPVVGR